MWWHQKILSKAGTHEQTQPALIWTPDFCLYSWPRKEGRTDFRCWIVSMPCAQSCKQFPQTQQETFPLVMWPSLKIIKYSCASYPKCWCGCRETSGHSPHYLPVFKDLHSKLSVHRIPVYYAKAIRLEDEDHTHTKTVTEVVTKKFTPPLGMGTATENALNLFSDLFAWRRSCSILEGLSLST